MNRIALVTGGNRGIGFEVCRQLGQKGLHVILSSRDEAKGRQAAAQLSGEGRTVSYHPLDVTDPQSVITLQRYVEQTHGRLDVLVNNAGVYLDEGVSVFDVSLETVHTTMDINFYGPLYTCRAFVPLMRRNRYGRVVNVSSGYGSMDEMGGYTAAYRVSKIALNALTRIVAGETRNANIKVNAVCPGWVRTEMGGPAAPRSPAEAADTIVWLATLPDNGPTDGFFRDRRPIHW